MKKCKVICLDTQTIYDSIKDSVKNFCTSKNKGSNRWTMQTYLSKYGKYTAKDGIRFYTEPAYDEYKNKVCAKYDYLKDNDKYISKELEVEHALVATTVKKEDNTAVTAKVELNSDQENMNKTLYSLIDKNMYAKASLLCDTMQKIFNE